MLTSAGLIHLTDQAKYTLNNHVFLLQYSHEFLQLTLKSRKAGAAMNRYMALSPSSPAPLPRTACKEKKLGACFCGHSQTWYDSGFKIFISSGSGFSSGSDFSWLPLKAVLGALHAFLSEETLLSKNSTNNANT